MLHVEIVIRGHIDPDWSEWLAGLAIAHDERDCATLSGEVADQSALYGLLSRLRDLGLALVSVTSVEVDSSVPLPPAKSARGVHGGM
jgi:hypothetical protein